MPPVPQGLPHLLSSSQESKLPNIRADSIVVQSDGQVSASVDEEVVLLSIEQGIYFGMDGVGSLILASMERPMAVRQICARLQQRFEVTPYQCQRDVTDADSVAFAIRSRAGSDSNDRSLSANPAGIR
jgi:hypothetical protein